MKPATPRRRRLLAELPRKYGCNGKKAVVTQAQFVPDTLIHNHARYRAKSLPAAGALLREDDRGEEQMSLI